MNAICAKCSKEVAVYHWGGPGDDTICPKCWTGDNKDLESPRDYGFLVEHIRHLINREDSDHWLLDDAVRALLTMVFGLVPERPERYEEKDEHARKSHHYGYIPYDPAAFLEDMWYIKTKVAPKAKTFIDVGHGLGGKPFLAQHILGWESYGVEYTKTTYYAGLYLSGQFQYYRVGANRSFKLPTLYLGDAFDHNFEPYDIIYLYHPMCDEELMYKLYAHIYDTAHEGAVIVEVMPTEAWYKFAGMRSQRTNFAYLRKGPKHV